MLDFNYDPGLTKEKILSLVTEKDIIESFIGEQIPFKKPIISPFRDEKTPSFTFKQIGNKIVFKDWGTGLYGDAFTFVQQMHNCSFTEALYLINTKLNLNLTGLVITIDTKPKELIVHNKHTTGYSSISIESQIFTLTDYKYWKQYGISIKTLQNYRVKSCRNMWLNGKLSAQYTSLNPMYSYEFHHEGTIRYKIYRPFADKYHKWICNITPECIEGYDYLDHTGDIIILTKSLKDVMCLREIGYNAFSLHGESNKYPIELHEKLLKRFNSVVIFYDNDDPGVMNSKRISSIYNLKEIFIPIESETKDISDFTAKYGIKKSKLLIKQLLMSE